MINRNFSNLVENYLFAEIESRSAAYRAANPDKTLLKMGIGDWTAPLCPAVTDALRKASSEMGTPDGFRGYGPYQGYGFLREAISGYYAARGTQVAPDDIFVSDGAKSDTGNITDLFSESATVMIADPVYPVYNDTNVMSGRKIIFADANEENGFLPMPDESTRADVIYLCTPNNPCGTAYTRDKLAQWVEFATRTGALLLCDFAYEAYVTDPDLPRSVYEIPGARDCAIEFCSLSKTAGFTGVRCGWTVIPRELTRDGVNLNAMWLRRQSTKFNGVSYIVQRGAAAVFTPAGQAQTGAQVAAFKANAKMIYDAVTSCGIHCEGGRNSPYVWLKCPDGMGSWDFFDLLLNEEQIICTPGAGFGKNGEGYARLSAFSPREVSTEAMRRFTARFGGHC